MKNYTLWLKLAFVFQWLTAAIHSLSFLATPKPANETERQLLDLMDNYRADMGAGFSPSTHEIMTALSACFTLVCLLGGLVNWYLWRKKVGPDIMKGILNINLIVFGICFAVMALLTFLPPIVLTGFIFVFLVIARLTMPRQSLL